MYVIDDEEADSVNIPTELYKYFCILKYRNIDGINISLEKKVSKY